MGRSWGLRVLWQVRLRSVPGCRCHTAAGGGGPAQQHVQAELMHNPTAAVPVPSSTESLSKRAWSPTILGLGAVPLLGLVLLLFPVLALDVLPMSALVPDSS